MAISSRTEFKSENVKKKSKLNELRARKLTKNIKNLKKQIFGPLVGNLILTFFWLYGDFSEIKYSQPHRRV